MAQIADRSNWAQHEVRFLQLDFLYRLPFLSSVHSVKYIFCFTRGKYRTNLLRRYVRSWRGRRFGAALSGGVGIAVATWRARVTFDGCRLPLRGRVERRDTALGLRDRREISVDRSERASEYVATRRSRGVRHRRGEVVRPAILEPDTWGTRAYRE